MSINFKKKARASGIERVTSDERRVSIPIRLLRKATLAHAESAAHLIGDGDCFHPGDPFLEWLAWLWNESEPFESWFAISALRHYLMRSRANPPGFGDLVRDIRVFGVGPRPKFLSELELAWLAEAVLRIEEE